MEKPSDSNGGGRDRFRAALESRAKLTPAGAVFAVVTSAVGLAAWHTGNNFLFALFSVMLAALLLSRITPGLVLSGLSVSRNLPEELWAGVPAPVGVSVRNRKRHLKSFGVSVLDMVDLPAFHDGPPAYFPLILPGAEEHSTLSMRFRKRGRFSSARWSAESSFPFGFFSKKIQGGFFSEFLVFPRPRRLSSSMLPGDADLLKFGPLAATRSGEEDEFKGLREYRPGDPPKRIHWKTSARANSLMVRECESFRLAKVTLLLDTSSREGLSELRRGVGLERGVRVAASLAADLSREKAVFRFGAPGLEPRLTAFGGGPAHLRSILEILAELGLSEPGKEKPLFAEASAGLDGSECFVVLVLSPRRAEEVRALLSGLGRGRVRVLDVSRPDLGARED